MTANANMQPYPGEFDGEDFAPGHAYAPRQFDYPFPRAVYETDEQYLAQGYFLRHPEHVEQAKLELTDR